MTILSAMQSAALRLVGQKPTTFFGADGQFEQEIADLVNEVAIDICKYQDWQALIRLHQITGDGSIAEFALPDDYDRMLINSSLQDVDSWAWGYAHIQDINQFTYLEGRGSLPVPGGWVIYGNQLRFSPAPRGNATFPYITTNYAQTERTSGESEFKTDADTFLLPERLLTLGLVWRWRENKKLDAAGDQEAFIKALDEYAAKDGGSKTFRLSSRRAIPGTHVAWPWELG